MTPEKILVAVPTRGQVDYQTVSQLQTIRDSAPGLPPVFARVSGNLLLL